MRLGAKSTGGWVGSLGACNNCGGSSNHTRVLKITDMTITIDYMGVLYFSIATFQLTITAYIARIQGLNAFSRIAITCNNHLLGN